MLLLSAWKGADAQTILVQGKITDVLGFAVKNDSVYIAPDSNQFQLVKTLTDTGGAYSVAIPSGNLKFGDSISVSVYDCNHNLKINRHSYTGGNIASNIMICVSPLPGFSGYVYLGSSAVRPPKGEAKVYMMSICSGDTVTYLDSVSTDTNGYFRFNNYPLLTVNCKMMMKARLLPSSSLYKKYLPAYFTTTSPPYNLRWSGAEEVTKSIANAGVTMLLPEAINPGGPAVIGGKAIEGVNKSTAPGDPLPSKVIFMTDMQDVPVAYLYTDNSGNFEFSNLQYGTYKLFGDVWERQNPDLVVRVDQDNVYIKNIIFRENSSEFRGSMGTNVAGIKSILPDMDVYPNPASSRLHIANAEGAAYTLTDITGRTLTTGMITGNTEVVDITTYTPGIYLLNIYKEGIKGNIKIVKQ